MAGVNKVILVGNLGKDPEIRTLDSGVKVATFSIATSESYTDRNTNEKVEQTEWHNIVLWRGLAEIAEKYLNKGSQVYVEGKLQTRSYETKEGEKRYTTEIVGRNLTMLGGKRDGGSSVPPPTQEPAQSSAAPATVSSDATEAPATDDLPF